MIDVGAVLQDRYEVTHLLAHGGMSDVFAAHDRSLDRTVAIKVVRGTTRDQRQRLEREARLLASFEHPSLVRIFDAQHAGDEAYVVLEYIEGPTLAEVIRGGPVESGDVARVGSDVAGALAYIHSRGVIHRDVKPSNVFVGHDGRTRLSDFGIARHQDDEQLTQTGMVIGTGAYMAPEQLEARTVGPPADVYALGLVLIECLAGAPAYTGTAAEAAMARLARDPDVAVVPTAWRGLLSAMTARDPALRPTAAAVASQVRALPSDGRGGTELLPVPPTTVTPAPVGAPRDPRRAERRAVLAAMVLIAGMLALFVLTRGGSHGPSSTNGTTTTQATVPATASSTTTTTRPTTTTSACAQQRAQRDALDQQERALADQLKGKALQQAKDQLEQQKRALDDALKSC